MSGKILIIAGGELDLPFEDLRYVPNILKYNYPSMENEKVK